MQHVWGRGQVHTVWWGDLREREDLEDIGMNGRMLKCIVQWDKGGMDSTDLPEHMERWKTLVTAVMNLWVPKKCREFLDKLRTC